MDNNKIEQHRKQNNRKTKNHHFCLHRGNMYVYLHRGNLAYGRKDYDEARSLYLDAIKVSPNMNENGNKKGDEKKKI